MQDLLASWAYTAADLTLVELVVIVVQHGEARWIATGRVRLTAVNRVCLDKGDICVTVWSLDDSTASRFLTLWWR